METELISRFLRIKLVDDSAVSKLIGRSKKEYCAWRDVYSTCITYTIWATRKCVCVWCWLFESFWATAIEFCARHKFSPTAVAGNIRVRVPIRVLQAMAGLHGGGCCCRTGATTDSGLFKYVAYIRKKSRGATWTLPGAGCIIFFLAVAMATKLMFPYQYPFIYYIIWFLLNLKL